MAVLEPLRVTITNFPSDCNNAINLSVPNFPADTSLGQHDVIFTPHLYIERADFIKTADKHYKRLATNQSVGLRHSGFVITVTDVVYDKDGVTPVDVKVTCNKVDTSAKPKAFIHWVSAEHAIPCEVRIYKRLFKHKNPEDSSVVPGGFVTDCVANSLRVIGDAKVEQSVSNAQTYAKYQFERQGYFCVDEDSTKEKMVFNQTIELKEDPNKK